MRHNNVFVYSQIEDAAMQQQVESYKYALREWDEQQQRHRAALQHARCQFVTTRDNTKKLDCFFFNYSYIICLYPSHL